MPETLIKEITNAKQNENLRYIDDKEIQSLKELLQKNLIENQDTKEKLVKETKNAIKKHIGPLSAGIKNFVDNSNRIDSILKQEGGENILQQYTDVLLSLQNMINNPDEKWDNSIDKRNAKERIERALSKIESIHKKIASQAEEQKQKAEEQKQKAEEQIQFEKGYASIQAIFGNILNEHKIIKQPARLQKILEDFCVLHNAHSNHKLSIENLGTEIFKLNNLQKEQFATHLATILSGDMKGGKDKSIALRQQIFGKLYTTNQTPPLLKDWKPLMHGDGSGTASNISGEKWDYDSRKKGTGTTAKERGGYDYSEDPRTKDILPYSNYEVTRPSFLNKLSIVFNIRGVNDVGAKITLTLPDPNKANQFITITGQTKGYPEKNGVLANSIDFNIPPEAKGISLENGSLVFDSKLFPKKPTIKIKTESLGTGKKGQASEYDEVIVDVFSDGSFDSNIAHADDGQQSYKKGEYLSERFEKELPLLTNLLKTRIPDGYKLPIALRATTDYTRVTPNLLAKLNTDLPELQKNLQAQLGQNRYKKIIDQVAPQRENFDGDEDNYKLAQCRVYEMLLKITEELTKAGLLHKIDINHISLTKEKETRESSFHLGELAKEKTGQ